MQSLQVTVAMFALGIIPAAQAQESTREPEIVVVGATLDQTSRQLAECLERHCTPKQDIDASLAHAENLFLAGDYDAARATLSQSVGRNKRYRQSLPVDVSDLQRAYGRMIDLNGRQGVSRIVQIDSLDSLKSGLDRSDRRVFLQRTLVADEFARAGRHRAAQDIYEDVEREAAKAGLPQVAAYALLRRASLVSVLANVNAEYRQRARAAVAKLADLQGPDMAQFRLAAIVLRAQQVSRGSDETALDAVIATVDPKQFHQPMLLYAPAVVLNPGGKSKMPLSGAKVDPEWMDVRLSVTPDGKVEEYEIVRQTAGIDSRWIKEVTATMSRRRYTPFVPKDGRSSAVRIERFSFVHDWSTAPTASSRMRGQRANTRVVWLDLTPEVTQANAGKGPSGT